MINKQSGLRFCKYEQKRSPDCNLPKKLFFLFFKVVGAVFFLESLDPAGGVHVLLLAGVKGMAGRADFGVDFVGRAARLECVAAAAAHNNLVVFWVNIFLHKTCLQNTLNQIFYRGVIIISSIYLNDLKDGFEGL